GRTGSRLELAAAPELAPRPIGARWVFAVDASRSMGEDGIRRQLALIPRVLVHSPNAELEVVLYRRTAERLFGRFVPATGFEAELARVDPSRLTPANGSHLEVAAAEIGRILRDVQGPARAVLFTDEELRVAFSPEVAASSVRELPSGSVMHVVATEADPSYLPVFRTFEGPLAEVAHATGGVMLQVKSELLDEENATGLEGLVRPVELERVTFDWAGADLSELDSLPAGEVHLETWVTNQGPPGRVRATGWLWGKIVDLSPPMDIALADELPELLVADESIIWDDSGDLAHAARTAHVASEATSFVVPRGEDAPIPPPVLELSGIGTRGGCSSSCGIGIGCRSAGKEIGVGALDFDLAPVFEQALSRCHWDERAHARGTIEVRSAEILDVAIDAASSPEIARCVLEALWDTWLPDATPDGVHAFDL
ncbi:MAG TPA: vWA domain-containing protein, partial [Myxococcaceae bacterium]|nr:vWA domain-containing protein [Myxococcaceae bacterium]